ncbi:MAG: hypothetical protein COA74_02685 [Gammaproteobacteria bacterium]|nr:MAG: hypothetical protein COA74_02685 [Gammaproteobacteria bacterium]
MRIQSVCIVLAMAAGAAHADIPQMGGSMSHLLVSIFDQQVYVTFESPNLSTVEMTEGSGVFSGSASVLDGMGHNAQFGWLANGFISLPPSSGVFIRTFGRSEHLSVYSEFGYDPIMGTDGSDSVWQWDGTMTHNWYASDVKGPYSVRHEVFVGDQSGNPLDGWISGGVELNFTYGPDISDRIRVLNTGSVSTVLTVSTVPAPGSVLVLGGMVALGIRRRTR